MQKIKITGFSIGMGITVANYTQPHVTYIKPLCSLECLVIHRFTYVFVHLRNQISSDILILSRIFYHFG